MIYVYPEKNLSASPDVKYDLKEWVTYKIRVIFEDQIPVLFKDYLCVANHNTTNKKTIHYSSFFIKIANELSNFRNYLSTIHIVPSR